MPTCQSCNSFVTVSFTRVFGDNEDRRCACPECANNDEIENQGGG